MFTGIVNISGLNNLALPSFGLKPAFALLTEYGFCNTMCIRNCLPVYALYYKTYTLDFCSKLLQSGLRHHFVASCYKSEREDYMKRDDKKVMSFRFEDPIIDKIDYLIEEDKENMKRLGLKPSTRKQIIEEAIRDYYLRKINGSSDPDTMDRIRLMIDDAADERFGKIKRTLDEILFLVIKNDLANRILLNSDCVPEPHPLISVAAGEMAKGECRWDEVLQDYMTRNKTRIMAEMHNPRRLSK